MSDTELEELLSIVGALPPEETINKSSDNSVYNYILNRGIKEGQSAIPVGIVYNDYEARTKQPLAKIQFSREFNKYFKSKRSGSFRYYSISPSSLGLPEDYSIFKVKYNGKSRAERNGKRKKENKEAN
jgi:hypothetical protein